MAYYTFLISCFFLVFLIIYYIFWLIGRSFDPTSARLKELTSPNQRNPLAKDLIVEPGFTENTWTPKLKNVIALFERIAPKDTKKTANIRKLLIQAGYRKESSYYIYSLLRLIILFLFILFGINLGILLNKSNPIIFLLALIMGIYGTLVPKVMLRGEIKRRQDAIAQALPDALDLLVICVEAGLAINAAFLRVGQELGLRYKVLSQEFLIVNQELRSGITREKALRNLGDRNSVESLRLLVGALVLADRLGTNIADTLRTQADSLRVRVRQMAEETAAKAGVKMLIPLVLFILPALMIILLGPGLIVIMKTMSSMAGR